MPRSLTSDLPALEHLPLSSKVGFSHVLRGHPTDCLDRPFTDEDGQEVEVRNSLHQRRATTTWAGNNRVPQPGASAPPVIEAQHARGAGVLRRLSLGGGGRNAVRFFDSQLTFTDQQPFCI